MGFQLYAKRKWFDRYGNAKASTSVITRYDVQDEIANYDYTDIFNNNETAHTFSYAITVPDPTSSEDDSIAFTNVAITITEMRAVVRGSSPSVTWTVRHHATDRSNAGNQVVTGGTTTTSASSGSDVTSFNDATIPADSFIWLETTATSGTVAEISITIIGTID